MIIVKTKEEIELIRQGGRILAKILKELKRYVKPGITTKYLDEKAEELIAKHGASPSFKGYRGYPNALCLSINEEVVHAIPSEGKMLKKGDIIDLDLGIQYPAKDGYFTDISASVPVGKISKSAQKLIAVTFKALEIGIKQVKPGNRIGDIGAAIQEYVEKQGFSVVRGLTGHGVGRQVHEEPMIPNYGKAGTGVKLEEGMILALEPMVNIGKSDIKTLADGWTVVTVDGSLSAHFEHTVVVTKRGYDILTVK